MTDSLTIEPIRPFRASVRVPGSKSLTNRALLLAALAPGQTTLRHPLWADDTQRMLEALKALGFAIEESDPAAVRIAGRGGAWPAGPAELFLGNAGTAYRFLTAACCLGRGDYTLDGIARMHQRPVGQLVDPLRELGAAIDYLQEEGFPPLRITGAGGVPGGELTMAPTLSSQYISALLQVAPLMERGLTLNFDGPVTSVPYVAMTLNLMAKFGVKAEVSPGFDRIFVKNQPYTAIDYHVEPDASNASYFLAAAAIIPGSRCTIEGLGRGSLQGDVGFADVLHKMGAGLAFGRDFITVTGPGADQPLTGVDVDLNHMPDMAQTLAVAALFAKGPTRIRNVGNLRVKETDRLAALEAELTKLGAEVAVEGDHLFVNPPRDGRIKPAAIDTYDDHRMAMSFAVAGLAQEGVVINDPQCVRKTYPGFFDDLAQLAQSALPD